MEHGVVHCDECGKPIESRSSLVVHRKWFKLFPFHRLCWPKTKERWLLDRKWIKVSWVTLVNFGFAIAVFAWAVYAMSIGGQILNLEPGDPQPDTLSIYLPVMIWLLLVIGFYLSKRFLKWYLYARHINRKIEWNDGAGLVACSAW